MPTPTYLRPARRARWLIALGALVLGGLAWALCPPWLPAARVLASVMGAPRTGLAGHVLRPRHAVREAGERLAGLRSQRYAPVQAGDPRHALLVHGAHPLGIDEPRLRRLARALAGEGLVVHTPELPSLRRLSLDPAVVDQLAGVAGAAAALDRGRPVAAFGVSVSGGLLLLAAERPAAAGALSCVLAIGSHDDLRSVARAYAAGFASRRGSPVLDAYGARVLFAAYADALVPPEDVEPARELIRLHASERYREARSRLRLLTPTGQTLVRELLDRPEHAIPRLMRTLLEHRAPSLAQMSPASGRFGRGGVPTFLVHGEGDPIIPSSETRALARRLRSGEREVRALVTPLLRHAERSASPSALDAARLVDFLAAVLAAAEDEP